MLQKLPPEVFPKKSVIKNSANFTRKTPVLESLFDQDTRVSWPRTDIFLVNFEQINVHQCSVFVYNFKKYLSTG